MNLSNNLSVSGETSFHNNLNYFNANANISNTSGLTFYKDTTDASSVFQLKMHQDILHLIHLILMHITQATIRRRCFYFIQLMAMVFIV